ncbi:MAG: DNA-binding response regulator [Desulfobacca sp. RBG_16_60_12]|nr:MAG: DNA-binding response regulator [Desulfobacca sp. RBG_16_60_12]
MNTDILIADDHQIVREGLRSLLAKEPWIRVVGEAAEGRTAVRLARELAPDVILMDVAMPDLNGIEATRQIVAEFPAIRILALSMHDDRRFVLKMLKAGAKGYLLKDCAYKDLVKAIRVVLANRIYLSSEVADILEQDSLASATAKESSALQTPSPREREVLHLLAEGESSHRIAESLHISIKTVESHRAQLMAKLKVRSVAELTKYAIREGLTAP